MSDFKFSITAFIVLMIVVFFTFSSFDKNSNIQLKEKIKTMELSIKKTEELNKILRKIYNFDNIN